MDERWLPVVGWEGLYEVSDLGRVRSLDREQPNNRWPGSTYVKPGRVLRSHKGPPFGYHAVSLTRMEAGRQIRNLKRVHVLVLESFVGPRPAGSASCHCNGDLDNNRLTNLRWDTHSANNLDKRRHRTDHNAAKTHCKNNHPFDEANTYVHPTNGRRQCRACMRNIDARRGDKRVRVGGRRIRVK
ncbi:NUMOD4 motif-containing HNH endonuclease [Mycobacterium intracellulare]|uniref:NUMOD4 motif-containing HNH endonuclease n=1 Tax=Mycobacterium intracellulare TaxID=1767 RepID=UPI0013DF7573